MEQEEMEDSQESRPKAQLGREPIAMGRNAKMTVVPNLSCRINKIPIENPENYLAYTNKPMTKFHRIGKKPKYLT